MFTNANICAIIHLDYSDYLKGAKVLWEIKLKLSLII